MDYILYYSQRARQKLYNVVKVSESKNQIRFIFADGLVLHVLKNYLLGYEVFDELICNQSVDEVLNRFDAFVDRFVCRIEGTINHQLGYTKPKSIVKELNQLMIGYQNANLVKAIKIKP